MDEIKPAPTHCHILIYVTSFHNDYEVAGMRLTINTTLLKRSISAVSVSRWMLVTSAPLRSAPKETLLGSPPKLAMFCCTHFKAAN